MLHPPRTAERRAIPWTAVFTVQFWLAPLVAAWPGVSLTRLSVLACIAWLWHSMETGHTVSWAAVTLWAVLFISSLAKNSRDLRLGFGTVFGRKEERELRDAAAETVADAKDVVRKIDAKTEADTL